MSEPTGSIVIPSIVQPSCESLEPRRLFAGIGVAGKVLAVKGTNLEPNTITVGLAPGGTAVTATVVSVAKNGQSQTLTKTVALASLKRVIIVGGATNDLITIDQTNGSFPLPARILTGNGDDTVMGGDEPDNIRTGKGNDYLSGGAGDDSIFGVYGNDTIIGGTGKDTLHGGRGFDMINGSAGISDALIGGHGGDTMLGGDGPGSVNTFFATPTFIQSDTSNFRKHVDKLHIITYTEPEDDNNLVDELLNGEGGFF